MSSTSPGGAAEYATCFVDVASCSNTRNLSCLYLPAGETGMREDEVGVEWPDSYLSHWVSETERWLLLVIDMCSPCPILSRILSR